MSNPPVRTAKRERIGWPAPGAFLLPRTQFSDWEIQGLRPGSHCAAVAQMDFMGYNTSAADRFHSVAINAKLPFIMTVGGER
jgi:hypothetical protein